MKREREWRNGMRGRERMEKWNEREGDREREWRNGMRGREREWRNGMRMREKKMLG